ncbi:MAG: thioesterase domain-containing protein [Pseudomonadota bacterium]|nr:thioesterase domain-containing protein [Pseudomonadota bacterium]
MTHTMNPQQFTEFLHRSIPLTIALGARVIELGDQHVRLTAPLEPNLNHHGTAFGGSLATLGILAGWVALHHGMERAGVKGSLVVRQTTLDYLRPVTGELVAESRLPEETWLDFVAALRESRRARIEVCSALRDSAGDAVRARGSYIALPSYG